MKFRLNTPRGTYTFEAADCQDGVLIDPKLPRNFDSTANDARPAGHTKFWEMPYIVTDTADQWEAWLDAATDEYAEKRREAWNATGRAEWFKAWPSGTRFTVRCLDGGAWDRSTNYGSVPTLAEALRLAEFGPAWHNLGRQ